MVKEVSRPALACNSSDFVVEASICYEESVAHIVDSRELEYVRFRLSFLTIPQLQKKEEVSLALQEGQLTHTVHLFMSSALIPMKRRHVDEKKSSKSGSQRFVSSMCLQIM